MLNGSYKVVNFGDIAMTSEAGGTVSGIYEQFEGSGRVAVMVSGITLDGTEERDTFVDVTISGSSFVFSAYGKTFTVKNDDTITIA